MHRAELIDDEAVLAIVAQTGTVALAAEHRGVRVEIGLIESERVEIRVSVNLGESLAGRVHGGCR